jgi:rsbT co-antagonist protein RsbR
MRTLQQSAALLVGVGLATAGLLTFFIRRGIISPLRQLGQAVTRLGAGDLTVELGPSGGDEIGHLMSSFSTMAHQLHHSFAKLETHNTQLEYEISERKQIEAARAQMQSAVAQAEATILAMATPIIPIDDQTLVIPLIGTLDTQRARQLMATVVRGIATSRAKTAILDITGILVVDAQVAKVLLDVAQSARLLGTRIILTGMRPEVAQSMIGLGVELGDLATYATLQQAIAVTRR